MLQLVAIEDGITNGGQTPKMVKARNFQWDSVQKNKILITFLPQWLFSYLLLLLCLRFHLFSKFNNYV
jgi:hypothetical protein